MRESGRRISIPATQRRRRRAICWSLVLGAALGPAPLQIMVFNAEAVASTSSASAPSEFDPPALVLELSNGTDARTRHELAVRLLRIRTPEANGAVLKILSSKTNDPARLAVCEMMAEMGSLDLAFIPPLLGVMQERDSAIALRRAAAAALSTVQNPGTEVVEKLKAFRQEQNAILLAENHAALMKALHDCTEKVDRGTLVQAWLQQPLALERYTALDIVQQNLKNVEPDAALLEQLRQMLQDPDELVRQKCVFVLRTLGQREDALRLQQMLEQPQPVAVREAIYSALGVLGDPGSIANVIAGLADQTPSVAAEAATALKGLIAQRSAPPVRETKAAVQALLQRESRGLQDARLRERVIDAMSTIADPAFLEALVSHAGADENVPAVRQAAVRGLGRLRDRSAMPTIVERLANDPDAGVREAAAEALGHLGTGADALMLLRERLDPRNEQSAAVQSRAWDAYLQIFDKLALASQQQVLDTWNGDPAGASRRVDLLTVIEKRATALDLPADQLVPLREKLGDALIAASRPADAAPVLARALETMKTSPPADETRVAVKMIDSYLTSAPEKAITAASLVQSGTARDAVAERIIIFMETATVVDPPVAAALFERLKEAVPDRFGPRYAPRFERVRKLLSVNSRPASTPAN